MILCDSNKDARYAVIDIFSAVDLEHAEELRHSYQTYERYWKGFRDYRWVILCDEEAGDAGFWKEKLSFIDREFEIYPTFSNSEWPQRERMLASFVLRAPFISKSKYFCKVDTDAFLTRDFAIKSEWMDGSVYVSSPWSYSKPANVLETLDNWADKTELCIYPRLNIEYDPTWSRVVYPRIISYFYLGLTDWHQWLATIVGLRLPFPSQDTLAFYVAERTKSKTKKVRFKGLGWNHCGSGGKKLENAVRGVMSE